jgi:divalent metal cation (Fe/Co/Zn/Cd) transporter
VTQEVQLIGRSKISRRIQFVQTVTIVWMALEAGVALFSAWAARSPALLAFGGDSFVELLSASVVLWRFTTHTKQEHAERTAARTAGILLFILAAFVIFNSVKSFLDYSVPKSSFLGIAVLVAAIIVMPRLAQEKRCLSAVTGSAALRADAVQSNLCGYLALVALLGLTVKAVWHIGWADPVAALAAVPLIGYEGVQSLRGIHCGCD